VAASIFRLLEPPVDLDNTSVEVGNVVKGGGRDVNALVRATGAQVSNLSGSLSAVRVDGDPLAAPGAAGPLVGVEGNNGVAAVVGPSAGTEARLEPGHAAVEGSHAAGGKGDDGQGAGGDGMHFDVVVGGFLTREEWLLSCC
jgi:hypothetical protein